MSKSFYSEILKLDNLDNPYQRNYFYAHFNQLGKVFVATKKILGENNFNYFASLYVREINSKYANMDLYGHDFSNFLDSREELSDMPYLKGVSSIDYYWFVMPSHSLSLERGMLNFWGLIINDGDLSQVELDGDHLEEVSIIQDETGHFLRAR